jgi:hemerythrin-like domain-containing protein
VDITKVLEADHRLAERLFGEIEEADGADRQPMIDELVTALRAHMELEEMVLYPAMEPVTGADAVSEARTEHDLAREALDKMVELAPDQPGFGAACAAAQAGIAHHVDEEETEVFPELRRNGQNILDKTTGPFLSCRADLGLPLEAGALAEASTKDELLQRARAVDIAGASSMPKPELAAALLDQSGRC